MNITSDKDLLIVMSGGGFPQIENCLGCLKAISEMYSIDLADSRIQWRGTSAGGIVATLCSAGHDIDYLIRCVKLTKTDDLIQRRWWWPIRILNGGYMYNREGLESFLGSFLYNTKQTYKNVVVKLTEAKTDTSVEMYGNYKTCLATSAIEGIFKLIKIGGIKYQDGGYTDNVPLDPIMISQYKKIIIILPPASPSIKDPSSIDKLLLGFDAKISQEVNEAERIYSDSKLYPNITLIRPPAYKTDLLAWSDKFKLIDYAYNYTINKIKGSLL